MSEDNKTWPHRFMLSPTDFSALTWILKGLRYRGNGGRVYTTKAVREVVATVAASKPSFSCPADDLVAHMDTAKPWSLLVTPEVRKDMETIRKHYKLTWFNETLCFALRAQASVEGWKP